MDIQRLKILLSHWWNGCAQFNLKHPHWEKTGGKFPKCKICGTSGSWIWGYKHRPPDYAAQIIQGGEPDQSSAYWAKHDGWR